MSRGLVERRERSRERGAVAVETALLLPLLVALVFGIINFGWILSQQLALHNAAREAARLAVTLGNSDSQSCGEIAANVRDAAQSVTITDSDSIAVTASREDGTKNCADDATVLCTNSFDNASSLYDSIEVLATYPADALGPWPLATITLEARAVYRCEFR